MTEKPYRANAHAPPAPGELAEPSRVRSRRSVGRPEGRVLLVGGGASRPDHITEFLADRGFEVESVDDRPAALAAARAIRPDVVLADVAIPHRDGAKFLRAARADAYLRDVPVILLLASEDEGAGAEWLDAGANDFVVEPVSPSVLLARVRAHTRVSRERAAASAALRAAEARLVALVDQAPVAMAVLRGSEHRFEIANDFYCRMVARRDLTGKSVSEAFPELDLSTQIERLDAVYRTGIAVALEEVPSPVLRPDGRVEDAYFSFAFQPLRNAGGAVDGIAIVAIEVTTQVAARQAAERQRAELRRAMTELQAVLDVVPLGIGIASDPECREIRVNPAFARQLGLAGETNASKSGPGAGTLPFRVMRNGQEVPPDQLPMQLAARTGTTVAAEELDIVHRDGKVTRLLEYAAPLHDEAGRIRGAVGAFVDITDRARLAEAERAARAAAEEASRAKTQFLAVMSHELRTPLNAIAGYAELLALGVRGPVTEEQRADLDRIQRNQRHLLALINDILNLARVEAGQVQFDMAEVSIAGLLGSAESLIGPQLAAKGLRYKYIEGDGAMVVRADPERVSQVLANLLGNAIKFTDRGGTVTLSCEPARGMAAIRVTDTGRGIASDKHAEIFAPFVQVGRGHSADEGTGLGLAISRDLAKRMGGDLTVESVPGEGSTFTLWLPLAR